MTQLEIARGGEVSPEMQRAADLDGVEPELVRAGLAAGTIVLPANHNHKSLRAVAIGSGLRIKVNANVGTSVADPNPNEEISRRKSAGEAGADSVMDLSTAGDLDDIRRRALAHSPVSLGTVPIYQAAIEAAARDGDIAAMSEED